MNLDESKLLDLFQSDIDILGMMLLFELMFKIFIQKKIWQTCKAGVIQKLRKDNTASVGPLMLLGH